MLCVLWDGCVFKYFAFFLVLPLHCGSFTDVCICFTASCRIVFPSACNSCWRPSIGSWWTWWSQCARATHTWKSCSSWGSNHPARCGTCVRLRWQLYHTTLSCLPQLQLGSYTVSCDTFSWSAKVPQVCRSGWIMKRMCDLMTAVFWHLSLCMRGNLCSSDHILFEVEFSCGQ